MSNGEHTRMLHQEIDKVHNYIEQCIRNYKSKKETINTLATRANVAPTVTRLVWERLEKENQEFFRAYYTRLLLKDQIIKLNELLAQQLQLMNQIGFTIATNAINYNGFHHSSTQEISRPNVFNNSGPFCGGIFLDRPLIHHSRQVNGFMGMGVGNGQMMIAEREGRCDYEDPCVSTLTCVESNAQHNQDNYFYNSNPYPLGHGHYRRSLSAESVADSTNYGITMGQQHLAGIDSNLDNCYGYVHSSSGPASGSRT